MSGIFAASCSQAYPASSRSEEHTSELQSPCNLVCRLLLEKKKNSAETRGDVGFSTQIDSVHAAVHGGILIADALDRCQTPAAPLPRETVEALSYMWGYNGL